jgi:hypothetical protein
VCKSVGFPPSGGVQCQLLPGTVNSSTAIDHIQLLCAGNFISLFKMCCRLQRPV